MQRVAEQFAERLDRLDAMALGPQKEQEAKQIQTELNQLSVSAVRKTKLREKFARINKQVVDEQKAQQKRESKLALDAITSYFKEPENKDKPYLVTKLPISANAKAVSESLNYVKSKLQDKSVYVLASDAGQGRVTHGCYVSKVRLLLSWLSPLPLLMAMANK